MSIARYPIHLKLQSRASFSFCQMEAISTHRPYLFIKHMGAQITHWGRVTHVCVGKLAIIDSGNGLSPGRRQTLSESMQQILLIGPLGTNFGEILIQILIFLFKKMGSSQKWRSSWLGLNVLICMCDTLSEPMILYLLTHICVTRPQWAKLNTTAK